MRNSAPSLSAHKPAGVEQGRALSLDPGLRAGEFRTSPMPPAAQSAPSTRRRASSPLATTLLLTQLIRACRSAPCDAAPNPAPFANPSRIESRRNSMSPTAIPKTPVTTTNSATRSGCPPSGLAAASANGVVTERTAATLNFIGQRKQPRQPDGATDRHHRGGNHPR